MERGITEGHSFADLLRLHRNGAGLTQEELAHRAGLGVRTVSNLERGVNTSPHRRTIRRLAEALELSDQHSQDLHRAAYPPTDGAGGDRATVSGGFLGSHPRTRLIARRRELGRVLDALEAAAGGSGRCLLLAGEPGIGKTRLAQAIAVQAVQRQFLVTSGRCYEQQGGVAFYPFLDMLDALYERAPAQISKQVPDRWPSMLPLLPDRFPRSPAAASDTEEEADRMLRAVTGFLREISAKVPVALLIDDLHWADGSSLGLFAHLARHTRGDRVLLAGTYRDVEVRPEHPLRRVIRELDREHLVERIELGRLERDETKALLSDRLDGTEVSEELTEFVHGPTDGNPFFTLEVLKALIAREEIVRIDGAWTRKELTDLATPETVHEAIAERASRLSPRALAVLEEASVLGQAFTFEDLAAITSVGSDQEAERAMEEAEASGLIRAAGREYAYDHALTQQTMYERLSPARRRRLHLAAAEALVARAEPVRRRRAAELSRHFVEGGAPERALPCALVAGEEAEAVYAPAEAERHYRRAAELAEEVGDRGARAQAFERLGVVLATTVRFDEALAVLELAADAYAAEGDLEATGLVEARIAQTHFRRGTHLEGTERLAAHLQSLDKPGASEGLRRGLSGLYGALARLHFARSRFADSNAAAARSAALARSVADGAGLLAEAEMMRGTSLLWLDAHDDGVSALEEAVRLAEECGADDALCTGLLSLHLSHMARGDFDRSEPCANRGAAIARKTGDTDLLAVHMTNLGLQRFYQGEWERAGEHLEGAVEFVRGTQTSFFSCTPVAYLGVLRKGQGAWGEAGRLFTEAVEMAREADVPGMLRYSECRLAELEVAQGRPGKAIERLEPFASDLDWLFDVLLLWVLAEATLEAGWPDRAGVTIERALDRARLVGNRVDGVEALRVHAKVLASQGQRDRALRALDQGLSWARAMPYPYAVARLLREYGVLLLRAGESERAREQLQRAAGIFRRLGAERDAEQTERRLTGVSGQSDAMPSIG